MANVLTDAVHEVKGRADAVLIARVLTDGDDWAELVRRAREVEVAAGAVVRAAVQQAREHAATWQVIGDALGVTRQAAFQRYGKPTDPRTGEPMDLAAVDGADRLAAEVLGDLVAGRWSNVVTRFDSVMRDALPEHALAAAWAQIVGLSGELESSGEAAVMRAGDVTLVNVPLAMEAGDYVLRLSFRDDRTIAGLHILEAEARS